MSTNFKDGKLYVVTWGDAYGGAMTYYEKDGDFTPMKMRNVGWVCEENDDTIVLCCSLSETGRQRDLVIIPWYNVISMEQLI